MLVLQLYRAERSEIICSPWFVPLVLSPVSRLRFACWIGIVGRPRKQGRKELVSAAFISVRQQ